MAALVWQLSIMEFEQVIQGLAHRPPGNHVNWSASERGSHIKYGASRAHYGKVNDSLSKPVSLKFILVELISAVYEPSCVAAANRICTTLHASVHSQFCQATVLERVPRGSLAKSSFSTRRT